jgi:branched-subunit amino acid transport protein
MIDNNYFLLNAVLLALGTIIIRGSFIALSGRMKNLEKLRELFSYIPAAVLPAFIFPATFFHQGVMESINGKERFLILIASGIVFFFFRSTLLIISLGLTLLFVVTQV